MGFALDVQDDCRKSDLKCPVLIEIIIEGSNQLIYLNSKELSAYADEKEVLL